MKTFITATRQFFAQIWAESMLAALIFVPVIMGLVFRVGLPALDGYLGLRLGRTALLVPFYPVFDLLLAVMTPLMFTAAGALVVLDEADSGLSRALAITPLGRGGYLASRIGAPALIATLYCALILALFNLSGLGAARNLLLSVCCGALGAVVGLMIPALAKNRVEGLAYSKLSGLFVLGLPAALLTPSPLKYLAGVLPSFWMTELVMGGSLLYTLPAVASSGLWLGVFWRSFRRRII